MRIGVYICHCGFNIASMVDVAEVSKYAGTLPGVVLSRDYKYMCSDPGQELIQKDIAEHKLNRVLLPAAPREHLPGGGGKGRAEPLLRPHGEHP
jgi:heterodisulfide reductase subunit A